MAHRTLRNRVVDVEENSNQNVSFSDSYKDLDLPCGQVESFEESHPLVQEKDL
jgi:hypothetical protein